MGEIMNNDSKRTKLGYWILTTLVLLPTVGSGIPELFTGGPEATAQSLQLLGYPLYLMRILGAAKILGGIAILSGKSKTLKEWAYAGFAFDFLGATASHILAGDSIHAPMPFIFFALLMGSYYFNRRREDSVAA